MEALVCLKRVVSRPVVALDAVDNGVRLLLDDRILDILNSLLWLILVVRVPNIFPLTKHIHRQLVLHLWLVEIYERLLHVRILVLIFQNVFLVRLQKLAVCMR